MALSSELVSQFAKATKDDTAKRNESTVYGTTVEYEGKIYVRIDGSDRLTPVTTTTELKADERVNVLIKDHTATVTGNISSPSASTGTVTVVSGIANNAKQTADSAISRIGTLEAEQITTDHLEANYAKIDRLEAESARISKLESNQITTENLSAVKASIKNLETDKLSAKDAEIKYANIDFANINMAAVEKLFAESGIIQNMVVEDQQITGELVGVTIRGDLIEGNTIVADKLVVKGENGLYYKLNTDGVSIEAEQTDYNSLNGTVIRAKSVTADKIAVSDLVAFGATIGGFHINESAIYSGVKTSATNTTRGVYLDNAGQFAVGDSSNFFRYFRDTDGMYKLEIAARSIKMGTSSKNVEETIEELRDEITTTLYIDSSRGTVFKNNAVSTRLSVVLYYGKHRITDSATMKSYFGNSAYLQWKWQRLNEDTFGIISSGDPRFKDEGFIFELSPDDVDTKVTFLCELMT